MTRRECIRTVAAAAGVHFTAPWFGGRCLAESNSPTRGIAEALNQIREKHGVPGLAAAAYLDGKLAVADAVGVRKMGDATKVTAADLWHIGSCTKSMTASLAAWLVDEGRVAWEDTVGKILGRRMKLHPKWEAVTLEQLLQNRSGAPGNPPPALWAEAWKRSGSPRDQRRAFAQGIMREAPEFAPGSAFQYSNQGFAIAGAMLEELTGTAWEELMQKRLFTPLEMRSAGFGAPGNPGKLDQPLGHGGKRTLKAEEPGPKADNPPAIGPAGTVHCSIGDLARFAAWHADEGRSGKWPLMLKPDTFARLHRPPDGGDYACGWSVTERTWAGGRVLTHNGSNTMWLAVMWVAPDKNAAFVAATNAANEGAAGAVDSAVAELISRLLGPI